MLSWILHNFILNCLFGICDDFDINYQTIVCRYTSIFPDNKVHGASMGPIWGRQDQGGPQAGPINFAMWDVVLS